MNRTNARLATLAVLCLLSACTHLVTNKGQPMVSPHPSVPADWPVTKHSEIATLVVVNPYEKQCCGATPAYTLTIRDMFGSELYSNGELLPIDDFLCVLIKPGVYDVALTTKMNMASHNMKLEARSEGYSFIAADVRLSEPAEVLLYSMNKIDAMEYVHRAAHRLAPVEGNSGRGLRLQNKLNCQPIDA